jgi:CspA family cold shock protein
MSDSSAEKFTGRVKWFNNKAGYGFITVTDGPKSGSDVFVHHSSVKVDAEQYKYLVQGEYIEFSLATVENDKHECQATNVSGIKGGKLMCETRNETRATFKKDETSDAVRPPRSKRVQDVQPSATATTDKATTTASDGEWTKVASSRTRVPPQKAATGGGGFSQRVGGRGSGGRGSVGGRGAGRGHKRDVV